MIEISLKVLILINITLVGMLIILFIILLVQKNRQMKIKTRKEILKNKLKVPLFSYLSDGKEIKTRLFQREEIYYKVTEEILYEFRSRTKGDDTTNRIQLFAENYLAEYYRELLQDQRWSIRMNTLYAIENFQMISLEKAVVESFGYSKEDSIERYQQLRVLAKLQSEALLSHLFINSTYPLFIYKEVLRRINTDRFDQVVSHYDEACDLLKIAILSMFAEKRDSSYLPLVERELENGHLDIRLQALKVVRSFAYVSNVEVLAAFAKSSLWQERMMFGKIVSVIKKERFKPILVKLIGDESWWVRNAAGEAIASFQDGEFILNHIIETSEDAFARDMAQQWLKGGEAL